MGTTNSNITVFDLSKGKSWTLHHNFNKKYGKVTCMDFSPSGSLILAGYENGQISMWKRKRKYKFEYFE